MPKRTPRILVADDEAYLRELLHLHLAEAGYEVELASDAIEAGYAILKSPPDLLVIDEKMPHMSGTELAASLVADPTVPPFPFIFLSGRESGMDQGFALGAAAYLLKPVSKDRLLDAVARALAPARRQAAA